MTFKPFLLRTSLPLHSILRGSYAARTIKHSSLRKPCRRASIFTFGHAHYSASSIFSLCLGLRLLHNSTIRSKGMIPDTEQPLPKESAPHEKVTQATKTSLDEYNEHADEYLDKLMVRLEDMQEHKGEMDVDYSAGVLSVEVANKGTWVFNKQVPNRQIWLSSPLTGPKRYDWVVMGESMHQKEGGGTGSWVYLRDGSSLNDIIRRELGIELDIDAQAP